ncbi:MAG: formylglycine-generating enzyme family protein [Nitrospinae bacterium]|nr:formylglycine-generating enzyme family protein [Nitrospinota bacterium]MDA1108561.1 formylglycine-generating enzyme family protein [Nitrospinota bacterium]
MKDKNLMIGIIGCFAITVLFLLVIIWEIKKSVDHDKVVAKLAVKAKNVEIDDNRDFSIFETLVGDDAREMILIPEGVFTRGSDSGGFDEKPQQEIYLDAFYVDKYEVTVESYNKFRRAANYIEPAVPFFQGDHTVLQTPGFPVVGVSWLDAVNFCKWAGKRLLTEAEWEKAARGTHGLVYPWGNKILPKRTNLAGKADGFEFMAPVGSFPMGRSVYGVYDMGGNVSEWVEDWYDQFYYQTAPLMNPTGVDNSKNRVFRGGSWDSRTVDIRAAKRFAATPGRKDAVVGFRCGRSKSASE